MTGPNRSRPAAGPALALALLACLVLVGFAANAQVRRSPGEAVIEDVLEVMLVDRELVALDALGGGGPRERLEIGERLLYRETRGRVGVVVTDRRLLAVGVDSGSWQETRYRQGEAPPQQVWLGSRVALIVTPRRVLGFDGGTNNLIETSLGPRETVIGLEVGSNVAVVVTDRRALGLSPFAGGFFSRKLLLQERIEAIESAGNLATVRTSRRLLTFRAPTGNWAESNRNLR